MTKSHEDISVQYQFFFFFLMFISESEARNGIKKLSNWCSIGASDLIVILVNVVRGRKKYIYTHTPFCGSFL